MSSLKIFREAFVHGLRSAIPGNVMQYKQDAVWIESQGRRDLTTSLPSIGNLELLFPDDDGNNDIENAIRIHKKWPGLTRLQARDPRLWTKLSHVDFWQYMRRRWPVEKINDDNDKAIRFIENRYFIPQSQSRSLLRNGISRLWWTAALSYDNERENPYELTRVLLSSLDITQQLLERSLGRASGILKGFLSFLQRNEDALLSGGDASRATIRHLAKFLNLYGGVCLLDTLSSNEISSLLEKKYQKLLKSNSI